MDRSVGVGVVVGCCGDDGDGSVVLMMTGRRSGQEGESSVDRLLWGTARWWKAVRFRAAVVGKEKSKVRGGCFFG